MSSQSSKRNNSQFVLPGERLGVIEEFIPDAGTYVKDGIIHSKIVGHSSLDLLNKRVTVSPLIRGVRVPRVGSMVLGQVLNVQSQNASIRIFKINDQSLSGFFSGFLHVSDVQLRYVESMFSVCQPSDILRARVVSEKNRVYHLSIIDKNLGVIYAFCTQCGFILELKGHNLRCPRCGKIEKRKTAIDYGKGIV